ncbi:MULTISPECIES: LCP family protein [Clostridium]|uniref:LCP family protein n=1 Tax=Clostridium senegalense TaxID=1465809 RepID=A0A6M0H174_9CLOT|nr:MULTISPECIES: LCP family protein [Clostridium]NEU04520.1 LCP family protein [Clostridium senegalense]
MKKKTKTITLIILSIIGVLIIFSSVYGYSLLNKIKTVEFTKDKKELGISTSDTDDKSIDDVKATNGIVNIAVFGIDNRSINENGRSDAMLILTLDTTRNKIKLSSLMRDSYVNIDGHGYEKLNHAYAYGGPLLAVKTINQTFNLDIENYITVNFESVIDIIDYFGGVNLTITEEERNLINNYQYEAAEITGKPIQPLNSSGEVTLTGIQALSYTRIREIGNGDFERTERQREVCELLIEKALNMGLTDIPGAISSLAEMVTTSLSKSEMLTLGKSALNSISSFDEQRFPLDGYCDRKVVNGVWYLSFDEAETAKQIHDYIYNDITPTPKDPLF